MDVARDHAQVRLDIWNDDDFRKLSQGAQLLYLKLLTSATLDYSGVADWRPKRIAALSADATGPSVEAAARELIDGLFIVVDEETEEVLVRSFLKHDGLLQKPNVTKAMVAAFGKVSSGIVRGVTVHQLKRLHEQFPQWKGFAVPGVQSLLSRESIDPSKLLAETIPELGGKGSLKGSEFDASLLTPNSLLLTPNSTPDLVSESDASGSGSPAPALLEGLFDSAWELWPKKVERKAAVAKFKAAAKKRDPETLVADIRRFGSAYAQTTEKQFVPALGVWLSGERWTDELPQVRGGGSSVLSPADTPMGCGSGKHWFESAEDAYCLLCARPREQGNPF